MTSRSPRKNVAAVIIAVAALSACGPQVSLTDRCAAEGYQYGTNEMNNCVGQKQQVLMNFMNNMQRQQQANYQQQMQFYQRPVYQNPVYQNPTINCSSNRMGNFVSTTCN
jgi:hypothetical protein